MKLLRSIELGNQFELENGAVAQNVSDDPRIISEMLVFNTDLTIAECIQHLVRVLSGAFGAEAANFHEVKTGDIQVVNFSIHSSSQKAFTQVASEHPENGCAGFIRLETAWSFAAL